MVPSPRWFPTTLQDRAAWFANFFKQFSLLATTLGFTAADVTAVGNDNAMFQFIAKTTVELEAYKDGFRTFRKVLTEGDIGDPIPASPADFDLTPPTSVDTGIFERLDNLVKRIRVSATYTPEDGALLGIIPEKGSAEVPGEGSYVPTLQAHPQPDSRIEVKFVRGTSDGVYIECLIDKAPSFVDFGRYPKSPATLVIPEKDGIPSNVQIRARYLDGNTPIGDWSDVVTVQTIP